MNIGAQTALALGRALVIAALTLAISGRLSAWLAARRGRARTLAWGLLAAPALMPPLLISYAFSQVALALVVSPWRHEALYCGVLTLKLAPVAVILRFLIPSPLSPEAWQVHRMLSAGSWIMRATFRARAAGPGPWIAGGVVFLLAFSDFELASLWSIRSWTVAIFDAQAGGLDLRETLRLAAAPLGVELVALAMVGRQVFRLSGTWASRLPGGRADAGARSIWPWLYLVGVAGFVSLLPLAMVGAQAATGFRAIRENFVLGGELLASALFAIAAAISADALAGWGRRRLAAAILLGAPGLLGALVVSLLGLAVFQIPVIHSAYDTPLPLLLALNLLLLPMALLLGAVQSLPTPALHLAHRLGSRRLIWEMDTRPRAAALGLLFCFAWFDFTASSILAPVGLTPVFVRLHNLAHYGQTAVLSAMVLAAFAVPVLLLSLAGAMSRAIAGRR